jgi:hypothetical protein
MSCVDSHSCMWWNTDNEVLLYVLFSRRLSLHLSSKYPSQYSVLSHPQSFSFPWYDRPVFLPAQTYSCSSVYFKLLRVYVTDGESMVPKLIVANIPQIQSALNSLVNVMSISHIWHLLHFRKMLSHLLWGFPVLILLATRRPLARIFSTFAFLCLCHLLSRISKSLQLNPNRNARVVYDPHIHTRSASVLRF